MFPLGTVLFPGALLPLHVFEPRYQALTLHCLGQEPEGPPSDLGIVLIERGSEVGGGDVRFDVGTQARIVSAVPLEDGRWFLVVQGVERIRVRRWIGEDPFPHAEVETLADSDEGADAGASASARRDRVEQLLRQALALATELGEPVAAPATVSLDPVPATASWQAATVAPLSTLDGQRVLAKAGVDDRLGLLEELLEDTVAMLERRTLGG